jgi:O-antigen ligase
MLNNHYFSNISSKNVEKSIVWSIGILTIIASILAIRYNAIIYYAIPATVLVAAVAIFDFSKLYFLLFASIPFSVEVYLPGGLATDLPTEPLMWILMGVSFIYALLNSKHLDTRPLKHPITIILGFHLAWIFTTMIMSENFIFSFKYSLAKIWYITVFYFLSIKILKEENSIKKIVYPTFFTLVIVISICLVRHAAIGFSFADVNSIVGPFFQNHVIYACLPATFLPFAWYATTWQKRWSFQWIIMILGIIILLLGIQFSYTRTVYVGLVMAVGACYIVRWKLMKYVLLVTSVGTILLSTYLIQHNRFLDYSPDFSKTVSHQSFDNLLNATYKMQDISTMERVYRWVAAGHMIADKPWMGFGPGNFYHFYKSYTVNSFKTYVSDNPEKSSTHCYFLMVWVEQGVFGLFFFLMLNFGVLLLGEKVYHQATDIATRRISLMATLSLVIINAILIINDMIETDKTGTFFFFCAALLVSLDLKNNKNKYI